MKRYVTTALGFGLFLGGLTGDASAIDLPPCPTGTVVRNPSSPEGGEYYCVKVGADGAEVRAGPYLRWEGLQMLRVKGQFRDGAKDGLWTLFDPLGEKSENGRFLAGKRDGVWAIWIADGAVELVSYRLGEEVDSAISSGFWRDTINNADSLDGACDRFQKALDRLRRNEEVSSPRLQRATGSVAGCRSEVARREHEREREVTKHANDEERRHHDPRWLRFPLSAALCSRMAIKAAEMDDIAREYRKSRIAGVVNRAKLYELQEMVVTANEEIAGIQRVMTRRRIERVGCSDRKVRRLTACYATEEADLPAFCTDDDVKENLDVLPDVLE